MGDTDIQGECRKTGSMKSGHCGTGTKTRALENSVEEGRHLKVRVVPVSTAAVVTYGTNPQKWSLVTDEKSCDSDNLGDIPKVPQLVGRRARPATSSGSSLPLTRC